MKVLSKIILSVRNPLKRQRLRGGLIGASYRQDVLSREAEAARLSAVEFKPGAVVFTLRQTHMALSMKLGSFLWVSL